MTYSYYVTDKTGRRVWGYYDGDDFITFSSIQLDEAINEAYSASYHFDGVACVICDDTGCIVRTITNSSADIANPVTYGVLWSSPEFLEIAYGDVMAINHDTKAFCYSGHLVGESGNPESVLALLEHDFEIFTILQIKEVQS